MNRRRPDHRSSKPRVAPVALIAALLFLWGGTVAAFTTYSEDRDDTNCRNCHGDFTANPYVSLSDGQDWGDSAHGVHQDMLSSECTGCHGADGFFPVEMESSAGGDGLDPVGCLGCHGRSEGGELTAAGLRRHHANRGISCLPCHADSNPFSPDPVAEDVLPPYYADPGSGHPNIPGDPCSPAPEREEDFAGSQRGLDNDGDLQYDQADADCAVQGVCGNGIVDAGEDCDEGPPREGDCCSDTCRFLPASTACDDGFYCTTGETCDAAGICSGGAANPECEGDREWTVRAGPLEDPDFAGSQACAACHAGQFQTWIDSLHARVLIAPEDAKLSGFPLPPNDPSQGVEITDWADVLFVVGQKWRTLYVDRTGSVQGVQWNYLEGELTEHDLGQSGSYTCGACHTTGFDPDATFVDGADQPVPGIEGSWVEFNIGCEACHGPGAAHAAAPSAQNINQITFDWYDPGGDGTADPVDIRTSIVCGNCHYRNDRDQPQTDRRNQEQYNDWLASLHSDSIEPTSVNTWCAKCHSPGNAEFAAAEHFFTYFDSSRASHVGCISCHDPHRTSHPRWATLAFPEDGQQDPKDFQAALARYGGTDYNHGTNDFQAFDNEQTNELCGDCHRLQVGLRRHSDARPSETVVLEVPFSSGQPTFTVPHREHVEEGDADCVDCHMHYSRESANPGDVRSHTLLPDEWGISSSLPHYSTTCGQCHSEATTCTWCHTNFAPQSPVTPLETRSAYRDRPDAPSHRRTGAAARTPSPSRRGRISNRD